MLLPFHLTLHTTNPYAPHLTFFLHSSVQTSGCFTYINRETKQEVPIAEYLSKYQEYLVHSKVYYDDPEALDSEGEDDNDGSFARAGAGEEEEEEEEDDDEAEYSLSFSTSEGGDSPVGTPMLMESALRKRSSSSASAAEEEVGDALSTPDLDVGSSQSQKRSAALRRPSITAKSLVPFQHVAFEFEDAEGTSYCKKVCYRSTALTGPEG